MDKWVNGDRIRLRSGSKFHGNITRQYRGIFVGYDAEPGIAIVEFKYWVFDGSSSRVLISDLEHDPSEKPYPVTTPEQQRLLESFTTALLGGLEVSKRTGKIVHLNTDRIEAQAKEPTN